MMELVLIRCLLATLFFFSYKHLCTTIQTTMSKRIEIVFQIITLTQMHTLYYASRTLPNTFAMIFCRS